VIRLPKGIAQGPDDFIFLTSILHQHVGELFTGMNVMGCYQFRVTRNSDLFVEEEEVKDLRKALQGELPQRHFGDAVRLEVADNMSESMTRFLLAQFGLGGDDLYAVAGPVNLVRMMSIPEQVNRPDLEYSPFVPALPKALSKGRELFEVIRKGDVLLHRPFQSFAPVIEFIREAARDPQVVAIKQTVYRTGTDSVIMQTLIDAAQAGKEVTVVVELMARFDEEANINWAERLEEAGAQVVYGVFGLKTHAKLALLLRREIDAAGRSQLRPYAHLGTGNYHPRTARQYTDFGLLTVNPELCADVAEVFLHMTSLARSNRLKRLWLAPFTMHRQLLAAIHRETRHAKEGVPAHIMAKMNGLIEEAVIRALYAASQAGVKIDLVVRGVCALRPGVKGWSDNIRIRSIVGRFLEHPRIWYFANGGREDVYLSSADWMGRNLFRRIEVAFPVLDKELKARVIAEGLAVCFEDNCNAWDLGSDGKYVRAKPARRARASAAQELLLDRLAERPSTVR
jgi:polyphosphate kinase